MYPFDKKDLDEALKYKIGIPEADVMLRAQMPVS
jgi:hypothetical protein